MFDQIRADLAIIRERDPAARGWLEILFCYPGFHALSLHRFSHWLWSSSLPLKLVARCLSQLGRLLQRLLRCRRRFYGRGLELIELALDLCPLVESPLLCLLR